MSNIKTMFPTNVYVKDHALSSEWLNEVKSITKGLFSEKYLETNDYDEAGNETVGIFTEEMMKSYPCIKELKDMFVDGFYELYESFERNAETNAHLPKQTKEDLEKRLSDHVGRLPFMNSGAEKDLHFHAGKAAFGVFYLDDVDNSKHGGDLVLYDPAMLPFYEFSSPKRMNFETKAGRMIVVPGYVWHQVKPYFGNVERKAIVLNLFAAENRSEDS